jgi:hypothetical protein
LKDEVTMTASGPPQSLPGAEEADVAEQQRDVPPGCDDRHGSS